MAKFYPHDIEQSRAQADMSAAMVRVLHSMGSPEYHAELALLDLLHVTAAGLPTCYGSFEEYLFDFWSGLSFAPGSRSRSLCLLLADRRLGQIVATIRQEWGFDMRRELERGLAHDLNNLAVQEEAAEALVRQRLVAGEPVGVEGAV